MTHALPVSRHVMVLAGDGIGPEVTDVAEAVLVRAANDAGIALRIERRLLGAVATRAEGSAVSDETLDRCAAADAVLVGAVGDPILDTHTDHRRPGAGLLRLRRHLDVFCNLRPVRVGSALAQHSALRRELVEGTDLLLVRELAEGLYFGTPRGRTGSGDAEEAHDTLRYTARQIRRVAERALHHAAERRGELVSVDKATVLASGRLWRDVVARTAAGHPGVRVTHQLVDSFALRLLREPRSIDVAVTENTFGDILSDAAGALTGSLGVLPSASLGDGPAIYEPIHGSAPDLAGRGVANPIGAILSAALLLEYSLTLPRAASAVRAAVDAVLADGALTPDLGGRATTAEVGAAVLTALPSSVLTAVPA